MAIMRSVVVLGGGLSGIAAAYALARAGVSDVTLVERSPVLGGLAGTFERNGHFYPLSYHHISPIDRHLLFFLDEIGAKERVHWRRIKMLFQAENGLYNLGRPVDFLRFPMGTLDKLRFIRLMLRVFAKSDWSDWNDRSASELIDTYASAGVRRALFDPLCRLKFGLPSEDVSGAWLGARLHHREGSSPLGYIPGANWTQVLCEGLTNLLTRAGVRIRTCTAATALDGTDGLVREVELNGVDRLDCDAVISSVPTVVYRNVCSEDTTPGLAAVRYTAVLSTICAATVPVELDFYWLNLTARRTSASAIFVLNALNPTIGEPGEASINFVTHLEDCRHPMFRRSDEELLMGYAADFRTLFGTELRPDWVHISRIPIYSPVLVKGYRNPPVRSSTWSNLFFAGNYRTFPSIVSTGTALSSGIEAATALLSTSGLRTDLSSRIESFRFKPVPA